MTRRINTTADSLHDALRQSVAEAADCEPDKVDLTVTAPGLDAQEEREVTVTLKLGDLAGVRSSDIVDDEDDAPAPAAAAVEDLDDDEDDQEDGDQDDGASLVDRGVEDGGEPIDPAELDAEADAAADFIERLLDIMELPGNLQLRITDDQAEIEVVEVGSGALIGRRGQTLEAIQELMRCSLQRQFQRRSRVQVDVEGYRSRRLSKLKEKAEEIIDQVLDSGESERLEPMDVFERKAIHHLVAEYDGVTSHSQGREPSRRVIIEIDES